MVEELILATSLPKMVNEQDERVPSAVRPNNLFQQY
jgi:hypothetical protein